MHFSTSEPLITFNYRYEAIHKVAFRLSPRQQENKTVIVEYAKKLPANTRDKLLRKITKKNLYIKTLDNAFRQAIDINRETSFVEAAAGRYNDQSSTKIETQINELEDSFQEFYINAMNTRSTNRSRDRSWDRTDHQAEIIHLTHQITEVTATPVTMIHTTGKATTETTAETEDTSNNRDMNRETKITKTGMITTKIETGSTIEEDQINTNTTETNTKHRSSSSSQIRT